MAKTSTHFPITSFIDSNKKNVKEVSLNNNPNEETIQNILNFSKALCVKKLRAAGLVEIVLN
ncbi:MAG: hypothetical protein HY063_01335 [Bacteroidetes bacterium]|nr:hypothetical protein [Bacteroidota bacterium]